MIDVILSNSDGVNVLATKSGIMIWWATCHLRTLPIIGPDHTDGVSLIWIKP